jgi:hypothetical protein
MAKPLIVKRNVKGSALTFTELDANFQNLDDATFTLKAGSGGTDVVSDLNGTITLVATDGIAITGNNTAKTISLDSSVVQDITPQLGGDLDVQTFKITTSVSNGTITIEPNGTGDVLLNADTVRIGDSGGIGTLISNNGGLFLATPGTQDIDITTNGGGVGSGRITITGAANGNITLTPDGTGDVQLVADTIQVGDNGNPALITSNGAGSIKLNTNGGTNSGEILINQGVDANIELTPNGNGDIILNADTIQVGDSAATVTITSNGAGTLNLVTNNATVAAGPVSSTSGFLQIATGTSGNVVLSTSSAGTGVVVLSTFGSGSVLNRTDSTSNTSHVSMVRRTRSDVALAAMNGVTAPIAFALRDNTLTTNTFGRMQGAYSTGGGHSFQFTISSDSFAANTNQSLSVENQTLALGPTTGSQAQLISTAHAGNLRLDTNRGTTTPWINLTTGTNGGISIVPQGTGSATIVNSASTEIIDFNTSRVLSNVAIRGNVTTGVTMNKGATYTIGTTEKQYIEIEIINAGSGSNVVLEVTNLTVSGTGGHYAVLMYNNSGSSMDLDILNNGVTLTTASKNMPNTSRHICTIYCVGNYAAVETMDAV